LSLLEKAGARPSAIAHLQGAGSKLFSAVTIVEGHRRIIVVNDSHATVWQASNLTHELSHVVLEHEPHRALSADGCRFWKTQMEDEADWLGGVLLCRAKVRSTPFARACPSKLRRSTSA
jgi:hypothetical protein